MKSLLIALALMFGLSAPINSVQPNVRYANEPPVVETETSTEPGTSVEPETPTETPTEPTEPTEPETPVEPTEPQEPVFEEKTYLWFQNEQGGYKVLFTLTSEKDFNARFVLNGQEFVLGGTYTIDENIITVKYDEKGFTQTQFVLNANGTMTPYVAPLPENPTFEDKARHLFQQAYFYIPVIVGILVIVGIPALIQLSKILTSSKINEMQKRKQTKKINEIATDHNKVNEQLAKRDADELSFLIRFKETVVNKKQQAVLDQRINELQNEIGNAQIVHINEITSNDMSKKVIKAESKAEQQAIKEAKKVKVKVKVKGN